jgi:hypothetical protein
MSGDSGDAMTDRTWLARQLKRQRAELQRRGRKIGHLGAEVWSLREQVRRLGKQWLQAEEVAKEPRTTKRALDDFTELQRRKAFLRMQLKLSAGKVEPAVAAAQAREKSDGSGGLGISRATAYRVLADMDEEMEQLRVDLGSIDDEGPPVS